jgi:3-oxoacyl-ACP reductase-like protein
MDNYPLYRELSIPMAPKLEVDCKGFIQYKEVPRPSVKDMTDYVSEMEKGDQRTSTAQSVQTGASDDQMTLLLQQLRAQKVDPAILASMEKVIEENSIKKKQEEEERLQKTIQPYIFLRGRADADPSHRTYEPKSTQKYMAVLREMASKGVTFHDKTILITGCGRDSIGLEIVKAMLRGGAKIYATTSRFSSSGSSFYHQLFDQHGTKTSQLVILPFNQSSQQDVQALVDYVYDKEGADIDYIIPFAAIPEGGRVRIHHSQDHVRAVVRAH